MNVFLFLVSVFCAVLGFINLLSGLIIHNGNLPAAAVGLLMIAAGLGGVLLSGEEP